MLKKQFSLLIVLVLLLSLAACGGAGDQDTEEASTPPEQVSPEVQDLPDEEQPEEEPASSSGEVSYEILEILVTAVLPETNWHAHPYSKTLYLYNVPSQDDAHSGSPRIQVELKETAEDFDLHKDKFENFTEIPSRRIGGLDMPGRTYNNVGMEWTEYLGVIDESRAVSVKISEIDLSEGSEGSAVLDTIQFG